ncbi:glycosyltransferase family 8 protein [Sphingorhabdus sp. SMR4y]|uniref:glycosyltransferase family 8 protein n=1 Tax=Sphingorhabdus sp. SMR4y TaxID=2584094 RepID=UPI000B5C2559|nr:glycosyltransferase [Sphingorhabdus sp. SMR4y]ASK88433.1 glycosyl transferase family 8 [Sphingorhabdus sp. SMR4y]
MIIESEKNNRYCLATVLTPDFVPGGLAMIHSFLTHNPWFDGQIVILHKDLEQRAQQDLTALYPDLRVQRIGGDLESAIARVVARRPDLARRQSSFYKGDLLQLTTAEKLFYVDSDMIFRGSIESLLFDNAAPLLAAGDKYHYLGQAMTKEHYAEAEPEEAVLDRTFGAGFMVMDRIIRTENNHRRYLGQMELFDKGVRTTGHTDQAIFNILFDGQIAHLGFEYNYHILVKKFVEFETTATLDNAIILHFAGWNKPWDPVAAMKAENFDTELGRAVRLWREVYRDCMASLMSKQR